jgi:hypothetical protein
VLLDNLIGAAETDAGARDSAADVAAPPEPLEEVGHVRRRDADPTIADAQLGPGAALVVIGACDGDRHIAPLRAVLDRVLEQVADHPLEPRAVPLADLGSDGRLDQDAVMRRRLAKVFRGSPRQLDEIGRRETEFERMTRLEMRSIEHLIEQVEGPFEGASDPVDPDR